MTIREPNNCEMCKTVDELSPSLSYCPKHNYKNEGDDNMTIHEPDDQTNYLDSRTNYERANEPEGITTSTDEPENWTDWKVCKSGHLMNGIGFSDICPDCDEPWLFDLTDQIEAWISADHARLREKVERMKDPTIYGGIIGPMDYQRGYNAGKREGYNQALDEVKEILK